MTPPNFLPAWIRRALAAITAWRKRPRAPVSPATPSTQLEWLGYDTIELRRLLDATPSFVAPLADLTDLGRHAKYLVVADLTWRVWYLAMGIHLLLEQEIRSPAIALGRSVWEALATLGYLVKHAQFEDEAVILLAYSYLDQRKQFAHQPNLVQERDALLARIPAKLVAEAKQRAAKHPKTWSGLRWREVAAAGDVTGYDEAYGYFSTESHGTLVGEHVKVVRTAEGRGQIKMGRELSPESVESLANFTRRSLHSAFKIMWRVLDAPPVVFRGEDPEVWRRAQKAP